MKRYFLILLAIIMLSNCSFMQNFRVMSPNSDYNPFRINELRSDEPLIIEGPFLDEAINEQVYIVTDGFVKLHKELWKKAYPESKDAEGVTRSRSLIQYADYPAKYKGDDVIFQTCWRVRAAMVDFVESTQGKKTAFVLIGTSYLYYPDVPLATYFSRPCTVRAVSYYTVR